MFGILGGGVVGIPVKDRRNYKYQPDTALITLMYYGIVYSSFYKGIFKHFFNGYNGIFVIILRKIADLV